jgi:hypothetical protein
MEVRALAQVRNLQGGTEAETMEDVAYGLTLHGLFSLLSYNTQDHQPSGIPMHNLHQFPLNIK